MVALPLGDVIDFAKERARLEKDLKKAQDEIARFDAKLSNEQFVSKAPEEVLAEQREKRAEAAALAARLTRSDRAAWQLNNPDRRRGCSAGRRLPNSWPIAICGVLMPTLFDPLKLGALTLPNRIIMAPLTRSRATPDSRVPTDLQADYYRQRAGAGLIITEATSVTPMGVGYAATPGIWSDEQTEGWKKVTDAVHAAGGRMVLQLWHVGRISDPLFLNGALPEAPSAIKPKGHVSLVRPEKEYVTPARAGDGRNSRHHRRLSQGRGERQGRRLRRRGYPRRQWLSAGPVPAGLHQPAHDAYGGSREKRARLMLEVADACMRGLGRGPRRHASGAAHGQP